MEIFENFKREKNIPIMPNPEYKDNWMEELLGKMYKKGLLLYKKEKR